MTDLIWVESDYAERVHAVRSWPPALYTSGATTLCGLIARTPRWREFVPLTETEHTEVRCQRCARAAAKESG